MDGRVADEYCGQYRLRRRTGICTHSLEAHSRMRLISGHMSRSGKMKPMRMTTLECGMVCSTLLLGGAALIEGSVGTVVLRRLLVVFCADVLAEPVVHVPARRLWRLKSHSSRKLLGRFDCLHPVMQDLASFSPRAVCHQMWSLNTRMYQVNHVGVPAPTSPGTFVP